MICLHIDAKMITSHYAEHYTKLMVTSDERGLWWRWTSVTHVSDFVVLKINMGRRIGSKTGNSQELRIWHEWKLKIVTQNPTLWGPQSTDWRCRQWLPSCRSPWTPCSTAWTSSCRCWSPRDWSSWRDRSANEPWCVCVLWTGLGRIFKMNENMRWSRHNTITWFGLSYAIAKVR